METQFDKNPDEAVVKLTFRTYTRPERPSASLTPATRHESREEYTGLGTWSW